LILQVSCKQKENEMTTLKTLNYDNLDEPTMWQAVLDRDAQYRGAFVYAVRSTGIYCLPTCPSRRPRRSQVTFFSSAEAAEAAGYRACRRCQPRLPISVDEQMVEKARRLLEQHVENPISLRELSQMLHLSPSHLQRIFKSKTGLTPRQYLSNLRLNEFKERIRSGETITSAMYGAGYSSSSRLYENAANNLGMTPAVYQK
jgi:AraC family transcriptional regulator of adaptative response/methylated-DNA-[protein]-cysteine methyltransferase